MSRIGLAARLARRELRRHPWRTALAVLIMALPIMGVQAGVLLARAFQQANHTSEQVALEGAALQTSPGEVEHLVATTDFPEPERIVETFSFLDWLVLSGATGTSTGRAVPGGHDPTDSSGDTGPTASSADPDAASHLEPITVIGAIPDSPRLSLNAGRLPTAPDEVALNPRARRTAGVAIGDEIELARGDVRLRVVGDVVVRDRAATDVAVVQRPDGDPGWLSRLGGAELVTDRYGDRELSWYAPGIDAAAEYEQAIDDGLANLDHDFNGAATVGVAVVAIVGGAIGILAVICSVAFTIGSRRRLRSLGLLSSSGASPADLALTVVAEGLWCGAVAAISATLATYAWWSTLGRSAAVERLISADLVDPPHPMLPIGVLGVALVCPIVGVLAAAMPARTAASTPVLTALGGRRPLPRLRTRVPLGGLIALCVGTFVIAMGVVAGREGRSVNEAIMVFAGLAVVFGGVAMAPAVVVVLGRLGARTRGTRKIALRGLSRDRTRNAAVIGAAAVTLAVPVISITSLVRDQHRSMLTRPRHGEVAVFGDPEELAAVHRQVTDIVGSDVLTLRGVPLGGGQVAGAGELSPSEVLVVDPDDAAVWFADARIASALGRGEAVMVVPQDLDDERPELVMPEVPGFYRAGAAPPLTVIDVDPRADDPLVSDLGTRWSALAAPEVFADGQVARWQRSFTIFRDAPITAEEERAVTALHRGAPTLADIRAADPAMAAQWALWGGVGGDLSVGTNRPNPDHQRTATVWVVGLSATIALGIVLVALALAAADGRDDERIYAAVGGPPALLRRKRTFEAAVLTFGAGLLGVVIGLVPTLAVMYAGRPGPSSLADWGAAHPSGYDDLPAPILQLALLVIGVTVLVTAIVWAVQALGALRPRRDLVLRDL